MQPVPEVGGPEGFVREGTTRSSAPDEPVQATTTKAGTSNTPNALPPFFTLGSRESAGRVVTPSTLSPPKVPKSPTVPAYGGAPGSGHSPWQSISGASAVSPERTVTLTGGHGASPA